MLVNNEFHVLTGYYERVFNGLSSGNISISYRSNKPNFQIGDTVSLGNVKCRISLFKQFSDRFELFLTSNLIDLSTIIEPIEFTNSTPSIILKHIYDGNEVNVDSEEEISRWIIKRSSRLSALEQFCKTFNYRYYFDENGILNVAPYDLYGTDETYSSNYRILEDKNETLLLAVENEALDVFALKPGYYLFNKKIKSVKTVFVSSKVMTVCNYSDYVNEIDVQKKLIDQSLSTANYYKLISGKVVGQNEDLSLNVNPDNDEFPDFNNVPILTNIPGVKFKVNAGQVVYLQFQNGDPRFPFATMFQKNNELSEIKIVSPKVELGDSGNLVAFGDVGALITTLNSLITTMNTNLQIISTTPIGSPGQPFGAVLQSLQSISSQNYLSTSVKISK